VLYQGNFCDEHIFFQLVWRSGLNPGYVTPIGTYEALETIRPIHGYQYSYLQSGLRDASASESRRQYLCPHLATASRLLPGLNEKAQRFLQILASANCNGTVL